MAEDPMRLDFGLGSDPGRSGPDAGPMHWNCFAEPVSEGKHPAPLHAADGLTLFANTSATGVMRGMHTMNGYCWAVVGTQLFRVDEDGAVTVIGGVSGTSRVPMARNSASTPQLVLIVDGVPNKVEGTTLSEITDIDLPSPVDVAFLNQRIMYGIADGRVFFSSVDDADEIDSLDFFTAEGNPDGLRAIYAHQQELWCFGAESIEIWRDTGDGTAPFQRNEAGVVPKGCIGRATIAALDLDLFWVGNDGVVYRARGYQVEPVSTFGVNEAIRATADKDDIEAMAFHMAGHSFYVLSGPDWTWAYNRTTSQAAGRPIWDPRFSYGLDRWKASMAVEFDNSVIVGDYDSNKLYRLSRTAYDEDGTTMIWRARTAPMHAYPNRMSITRLHLDFVTGVGLNSSDTHSSAPQVGMRYSDDGGYSWSNQKFRSLGAIGKRKTRVVFDGLGDTGVTGRIWEIECSSPVVRTLMYAAVEGDLIGT